MRNDIRNIGFIVVLLTIVFGYYMYKKISNKNNTNDHDDPDDVIENFYTLFIPYYKYFKTDYNKIYNVAVDKNAIKFKYYPKKNIHYVFGISRLNETDGHLPFINKFLKILIGYTSITSFEIKEYPTAYDMMLRLPKVPNKISPDFAMIPEPLLMLGLTGSRPYFKQPIQNIEFVGNFIPQYIYIVTRRDSGINFLTDLKDHTISIGERYSIPWFVSKDLLTIMDTTTTDPLVLLEKDRSESMRMLLKKDIDLFITTDYFPSEFLNNSIYRNVSRAIKFVPIMHNPDNLFDKKMDLEVFHERFPYYTLTTIDLYKFPSGFLPIQAGSEMYTYFKPDFPVYKFNNVIVCQEKLPPNLIYSFVKNYIERIDLINDEYANSYNIDKRFTVDKYTLTWTQLPIRIHKGAMNYYKEKGYYTTTDDANCAYVRGHMECTPKTLRDHKLLTPPPHPTNYVDKNLGGVIASYNV